MEDDYIPTNREKVISPRRSKFFCICDYSIVNIWKKCPICGRRNGRRRLKK